MPFAFKFNFLLRKIFLQNLNEATSFVETDITFKMTSILVNEIIQFRFPRKIFHKRKLTIEYQQSVSTFELKLMMHP